MKVKSISFFIIAFFLWFILGFKYEISQEEMTVFEENPLQLAIDGITKTDKYKNDEKEKWTIYLYLCGSDLESLNGAASDNLYEILDVELSENIQVIIQTGGSREWFNDEVSASFLQRFIIDSDRLLLIESIDNASMGEEDTLEEFLEFCESKYSTGKRVLLFWNHGSVSGTSVAFDENYENDSLTLKEIEAALKNVYQPLKKEELPFELVGFDACLMATLDVAAIFDEYAHYMVASEEVVPSSGWNYTNWLKALTKNPSMKGAELGEAISKSYMNTDAVRDQEDIFTLSVIDLTKIPSLLVAYENMGNEALLGLNEDYMEFVTSFIQGKEKTKKYGVGNGRTYDLSDWARNCEDIMPNTYASIIEAVKDCVVYNTGVLEEVMIDDKSEEIVRSNGLSIYLPQLEEQKEINTFIENTPSMSFSKFYESIQRSYMWENIFGFLQNGKSSVLNIGSLRQSKMVTVEDLEIQGHPIYLNSDGYITMKLEPSIAQNLVDVRMSFSYMKNDEIIELGKDQYINSDWSKGIFTDKYEGTWCSLDGNLVYLKIIDYGVDHITYSVPILLNKIEHDIIIRYSDKTGKYEILGAYINNLEETEKIDRNLIIPSIGDEITIIHYRKSKIGKDSEMIPIESAVVSVTEDTSFKETTVADGEYVICFEMVDVQGNYEYSASANFQIEEDQMIITLR